MPEQAARKCFVIGPIGTEGSEDREHSDKVLRYLIRHTLEPLGFEVVRADEISEPGSITSQVVQRIVDSDLVVADLTNTNSNVMYELALRHATGKPVIQLMAKGQKLPFDVASERTIYFDLSDIVSVDSTRETLKGQVEVSTGLSNQPNPFSVALQISTGLESGNILEANVGTILEGITGLQRYSNASFSKLQDNIQEIRNAVQNLGSIEELFKRLTAMGFLGESMRPVSSYFILVELKANEPLSKVPIKPRDNIENVLTKIYAMSGQKAYTYLWDWVLVRKRDAMPLIVKGVQSLIPAWCIFRPDEEWRAYSINEPILKELEDFGLERGGYMV